MGYCGYGFGALAGPISFLFWIIVLVVAIAIIRRIFWGSRMHGRHHHDMWMGGKSSIDILEERYAKGEIDKKEFEERKADLMKQ